MQFDIFMFMNYLHAAGFYNYFGFAFALPDIERSAYHFYKKIINLYYERLVFIWLDGKKSFSMELYQSLCARKFCRITKG